MPHHPSTYWFNQELATDINLPQAGSFQATLPQYFLQNTMHGCLALDADNFPPLPQPQPQQFERLDGNRNVVHDDKRVNPSVTSSADPGSLVMQRYSNAQTDRGFNLYQTFDQNITLLPPPGLVAAPNHVADDVQNAFNCQGLRSSSSNMTSHETVPVFGSSDGIPLNMERRTVGNGRPMPRGRLENTSIHHQQKVPVAQDTSIYLKQNITDPAVPYHYSQPAQFALNQHFNSVTIAHSKPAMVSVSTQTESRHIYDVRDMEKGDSFLNARSYEGVYQLWFIPDTNLMMQNMNVNYPLAPSLIQPWPYSMDLAQPELQPWTPPVLTTTSYSTPELLRSQLNGQVKLNGERSELNGPTDGYSQQYNMTRHGFTPVGSNYSKTVTSEIHETGLAQEDEIAINGVSNVNTYKYQAQTRMKSKFDPEQERNWKTVMSALGIDCQSPPVTHRTKNIHESEWKQEDVGSSDKNAYGKMTVAEMNYGFPNKVNTFGVKPNGHSFASNSRSHSSGRSLTWYGALLPKTCTKDPCYSEKVFVGGLVAEISKHELRKGFQKFEVVDVTWCSRENGLVHGCAYVTLRDRHQVEKLILMCRPLINGDDIWKPHRKLHYDMPLGGGRSIKVDVILWDTLQSTYFNENVEAGQLYDDKYSVFVGNLHGLITAQDLARIFIDKGFTDVKSVHIALDKTSYPTGFAKVVFTRFQTFVIAIKTKKLMVETKEFSRCLQLEPYIEGNKCCCCNIYCASVFCKNDDCLKYYCQQCFGRMHSNGGFKFHTEVVVRDRRSKKH
ncbi:unnamed protein product [Orchesella dallaii]|uniref:RRM domain-containing protein n=1 Tax=Orchesella dallaii TaxID=48710 RepID=A0ABP1QC37_9HEXA